MKLKPFFFLPFLLIFPHCAGKRYQAASLPSEQLRFGSGGGFTGAVEEFILLKNGQLFVRRGLEAPLRELRRAGRKETATLFRELEDSSFQEIRMNEPGNMYYFIEWHREGGVHRVVWGLPGQPPPARIAAFYEKLLAAVPRPRD